MPMPNPIPIVEAERDQYLEYIAQFEDDEERDAGHDEQTGERA